MIDISRRQLKRVYIGLVVVLCILVGLGFYDHQRETKTDFLNEFRVLVHPFYFDIKNYPDKDSETYYKDMIDTYQSKEHVRITIIDLKGHIVAASHEADQDVFLDEVLYADMAYQKTGNYKLSMPLYQVDKVHGFVIFEVNQSYLQTLNESKVDKTFDIIGGLVKLLIPIICLIFCLMLWFTLFKREDKSLRILRANLNNISKGIFEPIDLSLVSDHFDLFSDYNRLVEELRFIYKQEAKYAQEKKDFLTRVSHELKTPITTINAHIEGLQSPLGKDQVKRERYVHIISHKMQQLMHQVDDLFKYAQEEAGHYKYHFEECYTEAIDHLFQTFVSNHVAKIKVLNQMPKCLIRIDKVRFEQVLSNLINNALKHSKDQASISLRAYRQDQDIVIEVEDEGDGISPSDLPYIFDTYYQGDHAKVSDYEGIGLGLSICKNIIDHHQGTIKVKSTIGVGTKFTITLPIV